MKKKKYLNFFFDNIDISKANEIINLLINCKKNIIFTGIGKSAFIANKIAMTMLSTGRKAIFLPATDALHGDIAIVSKDDIFVILSKSGETEELINLLPFIKKRGAKIVSILSNPNSRLAKLSDIAINLPLEKELCPYNLVPTTSTCLQLIFGDILTIALMEKNSFSLNEYALNHPAGAIGKQISLKVEDLMITNQDLPICFEEDLLKDALHILTSKKCGCLLITDKNQNLKGIFSDGDLRRLIEKNLDFFNKKMKDIMTLNPTVIPKKALAIDALREMEKDKQITFIPVIQDETKDDIINSNPALNNIKNKKIIGLIRLHDIVKSGLKSLTC